MKTIKTEGMPSKPQRPETEKGTPEIAVQMKHLEEVTEYLEKITATIPEVFNSVLKQQVQDKGEGEPAAPHGLRTPLGMCIHGIVEGLGRCVLTLDSVVHRAAL